MKILHMTPPEVNNGIYRYIFNHMSCIDQTKYEFSFLTKSANELMQTREYKSFHFPVYRLNVVQRDGREGFIQDIKTILKEGFDVIHLHTSSWRGFLIEEVAMDMKIPKVIVHSHSSGIDFVNPSEREKLQKEHIYYKDQFSMKYATDVCACSYIAADWLFPVAVPKDKIQILPNAVDIKKYRFNREIRKSVRYKLGIEDRIVIGHVGRYSYTKNQEFLVRCFAEAHKKNDKLYLIMIGQGENISVVKSLVNKLGMQEHIQCYGWREDIPHFLQAADIFCLPSKFEGLPISVIEAQASGLHCLVSDFVTKESDITGLLEFLPLDEKHWTDALAGAEIDVYRKQTDEWFDRADYSMEASCKKLIQLYEAV